MATTNERNTKMSKTKSILLVAVVAAFMLAFAASASANVNELNWSYSSADLVSSQTTSVDATTNGKIQVRFIMPKGLPEVPAEELSLGRRRLVQLAHG